MVKHSFWRGGELLFATGLICLLALGCNKTGRGKNITDGGPDGDASDGDLDDQDGSPDGDVNADGDIEELPESWTLEASGSTLEVQREPYGYVLRDHEDRVVLSTVEPDGEGYAPFAWTTGTIRWNVSPLTAGQFDFRPDLDPWREEWVVIEARESDDSLELVFQQREGDDTEATVTVVHRLASTSLRVEATVDGAEPRAWAAAFSTPADEGFLGFGERYNRTDQRGVDVYSWAEEGGVGLGEGEPIGPENPQPNGEPMTYYPVPFFLSTEGYAFWLDTTWRSEFELATARDDAWRVWHIGPSLAYEVYLPLPDDERPWPYQLIDQFTERTGRPMIPPAWTFGPRRRIGRHKMVLGVPEIQAMRDEDLAITGVDDSVHFLPKGSHAGHEEELRQWTAEGHELGYRVNCYYNSLFSLEEDSPILDTVTEGIENDYFLMDEFGQLSQVLLISGHLQPVVQLDFTSPEATEWFQSLLLWAVDLGYDGFMYDFGEYVQADTISASGLTGEELHNLYPVLYQRAGHEGLEATDLAGEWLFFARSGYTGSSQWTPMVWAGDPAASFEESDGLPSMIRAGVNLGISGAPNWGGDIGGFHCVSDGYAAADGELLTRWIQQGSMTPNMQDQNACSLARDDGEKASIWTSPDAMEAWRRYARLHTRLFPYFWALAHEAHETGAPQMRHLFLEHPDQPDLRAVDDTHYLGPALLVAPVVHRGERERQVPFPEGLYLDWDHETLIEGGSSQLVDAPLERLPLFLRDGYLIPLLDATIDTLAEEDHPEVVGPADVDHVYDVVGLLSRETGAARFTFTEGGELSLSYSDDFAPPALAEVSSEEELVDCAGGCYLVEELSPRLRRLRVTTDTDFTAGGLSATIDGVARTIRWDLYLVD